MITLPPKPSLPYFIRSVTIFTSYIFESYYTPFNLYFTVYPTDLLEIRRMLTALTPNYISMNEVSLQEEEKWFTVCLIMIVMIDSCSISLKNSNILPSCKHLIDNLNPSLLVHPNCFHFFATEWTNYGLCVMLKLDWPYTIAAKFMRTAEPCRCKLNIGAYITYDMLTFELFVHRYIQ